MILALAAHTAKRLGEIGFLIGAVGALLLALDAMMPAQAGGAKPTRALGALLIAAGFVLAIAYIHWG